jgi:hypothetical protein
MDRAQQQPTRFSLARVLFNTFSKLRRTRVRSSAHSALTLSRPCGTQLGEGVLTQMLKSRLGPSAGSGGGSGTETWTPNFEDCFCRLRHRRLADVSCFVCQAFNGKLRFANHQDTTADQRDDRGCPARNANSGRYLECRWPAVIHHDRTGD